MKIKPIGKRILVKPTVASEKSLGGIIIPEVAQDKPIQGEVVAVASESSVKVGEIVMFGKFSGQEVEFEAVKYLIMREEDLMAIIHDKA